MQRIDCKKPACVHNRKCRTEGLDYILQETYIEEITIDDEEITMDDEEITIDDEETYESLILASPP